jgi:hypothetical protein
MVISWTFGPETPVLAYLKFGHAEIQNVDEDLKIDEFLLTAGAPLEVKTTLERYGRPIPDKKAVLLTKPEPPPVPPKGPGQSGQGGPPPEVANDRPDLPALEESGLEHYASALAHDLQAMRERVAALDQITDDNILRQRALDLVGQVDQLKKDLLHLPKAAQALAEVQIAAFMTGLTQGRKVAKAQ